MQPVDQQVPGRGIKPLDSLLRHTRLMILLFIGILLAGVPLVFMLGKPSYQAVATVQVSPRYMKTLRDDIELEFQSNTQYLQFIEQQRRTINRYDVLELALQTLAARPGATNNWQLPGETARASIERLQRNLQVSAVSDSYLVQVRLEAEQPQGLDELVNAVVDAYLVRARDERIFGADERVASLKARESALLLQIDSMTAERTTIARELGVTAFNPAEKNPFDMRMQKLQEDLASIRLQRLDAETKLAAFLAMGETDLTMESIQDSILSDPGLNSLKASLNQRRATLVTTASGLSSEHPAWRDAQDELALIEQEISSREAELRERLRSGLESRYRSTVTQASEMEARMNATLADVSARSGDYSQGYNRAISLSNHLDLLWGELDTVRERLNFFEGEDSSAGFVHLVTPARPALIPSGAGKKKIALLVIVAAIAGSLAAPLLLDLFDNRIRTVNDAHRILGFAPLGWIVDKFGRQSEEFADDQLRRIASGLIRDRDKHGTRSVMVTSVKPGGGTTDLARSLVRCFNQLGFAALAVEANAFRHDAVYGDGPGLAALLDSEDATAVINHSAAQLPCLPVGTSGDKGQLGNLQRLQPVLAALPAHYEFIVIDAPPLLTSSDAELIARAADAALLVVEAGSTTKGELQRAARLLHTINPPVVGTVVNRVSAFHSGGYIELLMQEYHSGRKVAGSSLLPALKATAHALAWDLLALCFHVVLTPLQRYRSARLPAAAAADKTA